MSIKIADLDRLKAHVPISRVRVYVAKFKPPYIVKHGSLPCSIVQCIVLFRYTFTNNYLCEYFMFFNDNHPFNFF